MGGACWLRPWVAGQEEGPQGECSKDGVRWPPASRTPGSVLEIAALRPHPSPTGPQLNVKQAPTENTDHGMWLALLLECWPTSFLPQGQDNITACTLGAGARTVGNVSQGDFRGDGSVPGVPRPPHVERSARGAPQMAPRPASPARRVSFPQGVRGPF